MSVIQKLNEYTDNPCKHNISLSQFRTNQSVKIKFRVFQNMYLNMKTMFKLFMSENCLIMKY